MDELDDHGHGDVRGVVVPAGAGCQKDRERTQSLAAAVGDVVSDLIDEGHVAAEALENKPVDRGPVVFYQGPELVQGRCFWLGFGGLHCAHNAR